MPKQNILSMPKFTIVMICVGGVVGQNPMPKLI